MALVAVASSKSYSYSCSYSKRRIEYEHEYGVEREHATAIDRPRTLQHGIDGDSMGSP